MSVTTRNVAPTNTSAVAFVMPPGPCTVVISNTSGVTVYVGAGSEAVSATNGFAIPNGAPPVTIPAYPGSAGTPINVIAPTGSVTGVVSWVISTAQ